MLTVEGDMYLKVMGNYHEEITGAKNQHQSNGPQSESSGSSDTPDSSTIGGAVKSADTNVVGAASSGSATLSKNTESLSDVSSSSGNQRGSAYNFYKKPADKRYQVLKRNNIGGFYPVDEIPFHPDADEWGRTPHGPCLLYTSPSPRDATLSRMPSSA